MRKRLVVIFLAAASITAVALIASNGQSKRVVYLKTRSSNRLLIYTAPTDADAAAILGRSPWTSGRLTTAYFYSPAEVGPAARAVNGAARNIVAVAADVESAAPGYSCRLTINPKGARALSGPCAKR
ncbi:hypothetical protein U879_05765 [Defluviimonas sp. 20V17]|uniref:Uncharacterized protein n=1 Tax=Allgaiera indica TaxID=765699 RepID=A0AAN5A161_9RHOB|nr:hypothetical protein [Allgaiera indica]KDB04643.1 hypothetical protein U879_05765 [Defluviimonas sp. 20V17]GHE03720.1 hypothetical protein GCM10008024_28200 [Allgaiera indica]SDX73892.1 hypothetical protein SAMN05444006_12716 [Allgaiera indica]